MISSDLRFYDFNVVTTYFIYIFFLSFVKIKFLNYFNKLIM